MSLTSERPCDNGASVIGRPTAPSAPCPHPAQPAGSARGILLATRTAGRSGRLRHPARGSLPSSAKTACGLRERLRARAEPSPVGARPYWSFPGRTHHRLESVEADRFTSLVGRGLCVARSCRHDCTALPALCRAHRRGEKHGPLLCHVDRANVVWPSVPHPSMGTHRCFRAKAGASFPARGGSGRALPRTSQAEALARVRIETPRRAKDDLLTGDKKSLPAQQSLRRGSMPRRRLRVRDFGGRRSLP